MVLLIENFLEEAAQFEDNRDCHVDTGICELNSLWILLLPGGITAEGPSSSPWSPSKIMKRSQLSECIRKVNNHFISLCVTFGSASYLPWTSWPCS
jgi:hypothetical protein